MEADPFDNLDGAMRALRADFGRCTICLEDIAADADPVAEDARRYRHRACETVGRCKGCGRWCMQNEPHVPMLGGHVHPECADRAMGKYERDKERQKRTQLERMFKQSRSKFRASAVAAARAGESVGWLVPPGLVQDEAASLKHAHPQAYLAGGAERKAIAFRDVAGTVVVQPFSPDAMAGVRGYTRVFIARAIIAAMPDAPLVVASRLGLEPEQIIIEGD